MGSFASLSWGIWGWGWEFLCCLLGGFRNIFMIHLITKYKHLDDKNNIIQDIIYCCVSLFVLSIQLSDFGDQTHNHSKINVVEFHYVCMTI